MDHLKTASLTTIYTNIKGAMVMQNSITKGLGFLPTMNANRWTAVVIWLCGAWLTSQALGQVGVPDPFNIVVGLAVQWVLTKAESPLWRGKGWPKMAVGATIVDVAINSAGAWPYAKGIGKTDFWQMARDIMGDQKAEPTQSSMITLAVGVGAFTAAAAEYFWNLEV
jgi:hypothetical protein